MSFTKEYFLSIIQRIFSNWTALRLSVEQGMGTKEDVIELCTYVTNMLYMNENLCYNDFASELWELVDDWFNTELEDESHVHVAQVLLKFYQFCIEANVPAVLAELEKLPPLQPWLLSTKSVQSVKQGEHHNVVESQSSEFDSDNELEEGNASPKWQTVRRRRH